MNKETRDKLERQQKSYNDNKPKYKNGLLEAIKSTLKNTLRIPIGQTIDIKEIVWENYFDTIIKYDRPEYYPGNYIIRSFSIDKDGKLTVEAFEQFDNKREWTFSENNLTIIELERILDNLETIAEGLKEGLLVMEKGFNVKNAQK